MRILNVLSRKGERSAPPQGADRPAKAQGGNVIRATDLTKTYAADGVEVRALRNVSLDVDAGSFIAFIGPSGSGKTTLLNLLGCLDKPTSGHLEVAGTDVARLDRRGAAAFRGARIGFVFQSFNLVPVLTAFENVEYPLVMVQERPTRERRARCSSSSVPSGWPTSGTSGPNSSRAARSSGWPSPERSSHTPSWCWRTSRRRTSTARPPTRSSRS
jgi:ABC-type glutathione transport system ATPase component